MSASAEKVLACVSADASSMNVVQEAVRIAQALDAGTIALYVETPELARLPVPSRERVLRALQRAAELGAETYTLGSVDVAHTILEFAREHAVTRIVVGKSTRPAWLRRIAGSMVDTLVSHSSEQTIEILGDRHRSESSSDSIVEGHKSPARRDTRRKQWPRYVAAATFVLIAGATGLLLQPILPSASIVMLYLLTAMLSGLYLGRGPAVFTALCGGLSFNFLFTAPQLTLHIYQLTDAVNVAALLTVGLVVAQLSARARHQARVAVQREERAVSLGAFTGSLLGAQTEREIATIACAHIGRAFDADVDLWMREHPLAQSAHCVSSGGLETDVSSIHYAMESGTPAGAGTSACPGKLHYMPVVGAGRAIAVLAIRPRVWKRLFLPEPRKALQSYSRQLALALERMQLLQQKKLAELAMRAEDLRNDLLAGLSHDLRTPLASILGSSSALAEDKGELSEPSRRELIATVHEETLRMTRLVTNLLEMARLTRGFASLKREWIPIEELIGSVRHRLAPLLSHRSVSVSLAPNLPLAFVDGLLFEQVLQNLLENAVKYSPDGTPIEITANEDVDGNGRGLRIVVADRGIGVPQDSRKSIFEKFHRAHVEGAQSGMGLGLALCKSVVFLHEGSIGVDDRAGGGSSFWVKVPSGEQEPSFEEQSVV